ncbi:hypothetical protein [Sunxiuqinia sp. sy24]|uniref:hypothetical protein n=1 Tax=Sunxiuqinia sp. sy24 TaxID=3461495 RepID=UPI0040457081
MKILHLVTTIISMIGIIVWYIIYSKFFFEMPIGWPLGKILNYWAAFIFPFILFFNYSWGLLFPNDAKIHRLEKEIKIAELEKELAELNTKATQESLAQST